MSEWTFSAKEYTPAPQEPKTDPKWSYNTVVPEGTYRAEIGLVRWKHWDDGGKTLKVFFNLGTNDNGTEHIIFVWDCSVVNKRNSKYEDKAKHMLYELCTVLQVDGLSESTIEQPIGSGGILGGKCRVKLVVLEPSDRFPDPKNWLVGFRSVDGDKPHQVDQGKVEASVVDDYDDDDIPF